MKYVTSNFWQVAMVQQQIKVQGVEVKKYTEINLKAVVKSIIWREESNRILGKLKGFKHQLVGYQIKVE